MRCCPALVRLWLVFKGSGQWALLRARPRPPGTAFMCGHVQERGFCVLMLTVRVDSVGLCTVLVFVNDSEQALGPVGHQKASVGLRISYSSPPSLRSPTSFAVEFSYI